jgi:transposase InsO family protein
MCKCLDVKRANYYKWLKHNKTHDNDYWNEVIELVLRYHKTYDHRLGYRSIRDRIEKDTGKKYNDYTIHKVMKYLGIQSRIRQNRHSCTIRVKGAKTAPNLLARDFNAAAPNTKWVTDVTEFKYGKQFESKIYLSLIMDLYDRYPVSFIISDHNNNPLVFETFEKAIEANPGVHPLFHSDAGFQYTSPIFVRRLKDLEIVQSMSRIGKCIDNGPMEGFWGILKSEMYYGKHYYTKKEITQAINDWIKYYTYERLQRRFNIQTPYEVRRAALKVDKPVEYKIPENKHIIQYKQEHYTNYRTI